jgi:hypothetical protein
MDSRFLLSLLLLASAAHPTLAQTTQREHPAPAPIRPASRFTLTPTQNIWVSLLLDSSNGRIWQIHFSVSDSSFAGRLPISEEALVPATEAHAGRFTLQETSNIFTFLLLDHDDGRVWQVQWSNDESTRGVMRQLSQAVH